MAKTKEITKAQAITIAAQTITDMEVDMFDNFTKEEVVDKLTSIVESLASKTSDTTEKNIALAQKFAEFMENGKAYTVAEFVAEFTQREVVDTGEKLVETFAIEVDGETIKESKSKYGAIFKAGAGAGIFTEGTEKGKKVYTIAEE